MADEQKKMFGLLFATDDGEGSVKIREEFHAMEAITRADILQRWMSQLAEIYDVAYQEAFQDKDLASGERE